jgi:mono/diheme cytochrome c family protein
MTFRALVASCLLTPLWAQDPPQAPDFATQIRPILAQHCHKCHGAEQQKGGLRLDTRAAALHGGDDSDRVLVPGRSAESDLLKRIRSADPDVMMPPKGKRLAAEQIELLRRWIDAGAPWPEESALVSPTTPGRVITPEQRSYWAFRPVRKPAVPAVARARTAVDAFILARLEKEGLEPAPEASKLDLVRRVFFDLTGLPPSPREIDEFVRDPALDAYEKMVDRVLASPRYGERWAQHWLDVVRFGESEGFEYDTPVGSLWRYRDYGSTPQRRQAVRPVHPRAGRRRRSIPQPRGVDRRGFHRLGPVRQQGEPGGRQQLRNGC